MKKLSHLCLAFLIAFSVFAFTGCGKNPVESATVRGLSLTVVKNDELDTSKAVVTAKYKGGDKKDFSGNDLSFGALDTSTTGQKELSIKIVPENFTFKVTIKVVADEADVAAISQLESQLLKEYNANRTNTEYQEKFVHQDEPLYVGHNNTFHFRLKAAGIGADGETLITDIGRVRTVVTVEKKNNDQQYELLEGTDLAQYVEVNPINAQFEFKEAAEDGTFRITVEPANPDEAYEESNYKFTAEVVVVDGFNVYDTTDLSVYDNFNTSANPLYGNEDHDMGWKYAEEGWKPFHDEVKARYGLTDTGIANIKRIIFQADIVIDQSTAEGKVREDFFWQTDDADYLTHENESDVDVVLGTPHNISEYALFHREIKDGETFDVIGNYFSINASKMPLMVSCEQTDAENDGVNSELNRGMTAYSAIFRTEPKHGVTITDPNTRVEYRNMTYIGNGEMSPDMKVSGSILLMKHDEINFYGYNTVANNFYMSYYFAYGNPNNPNDGVYTVEDCRGFNSYSSLIYLYAAEKTNIINCEFKHAGGPAILAECETEMDTYSGEDTLAAYRTASKILLPPEINLVASTIESKVSGQEGWFTTCGAGTAVGEMIQLGTAITAEGWFEGKGGYDATGKTIVADTMTDGNKPVDRINIQCVIFGPGIVECSDNISGKINVFKTIDEFDQYLEDGTLPYHGVDLYDGEPTEKLEFWARQGMPVFECVETGSYRSATIQYEPGLMKGDNAQGWTGDFVNLYLPPDYGNMGALLGLYPAA